MSSWRSLIGQCNKAPPTCQVSDTCPAHRYQTFTVACSIHLPGHAVDHAIVYCCFLFFFRVLFPLIYWTRCGLGCRYQVNLDCKLSMKITHRRKTAGFFLRVHHDGKPRRIIISPPTHHIRATKTLSKPSNYTKIGIFPMTNNSAGQEIFPVISPWGGGEAVTNVSG